MESNQGLSCERESAPVSSGVVESARVESTPVKSTPVKSTPVKSTPVKSTPVKSTPATTTPATTTPTPTKRPLSPHPSLPGRRLLRKLLESSEEEDEYVPRETEEKSDHEVELVMEVESDDEPVNRTTQRLLPL